MLFISRFFLDSEKIFMKDGGHVCLDWFNEGASCGEERRDNGDPIVLILPGVTGQYS